MDRESRERSGQGGHCPKEWVRPVRPHRGEILPQNVPISMLAQDLQIWVPGLRTWQTLLPFPILDPSLKKKPGAVREQGASHLHSGHVDAGPHLELGTYLDDLGYTVE